MNLNKTTRRSIISPKFPSIDEYPHPLQWYSVPPRHTIALAELEEFLSERLSVLQAIDEISTRTQARPGSDDWRKAIDAELKKLELRDFRKLIIAAPQENAEADYNLRKKDHISHFMLRLAFCKTEENRKWFTSREVELLRLRWMFLSAQQRRDFLKTNDLNYELMKEAERNEIVSKSNGYVTMGVDFYRISFVYASDLIRQRKSFLYKGYVYISNDDIISVLLVSFRSKLSESLTYASRRVHSLVEDERLDYLLKGVSKTRRDVSYSNYSDKDHINISQLDTLAKISYPLCMQNLHQILKTEHHLKHGARLQYGLFLKGIGVTLEDSLKFWKTEFTKKMDPDKFDKEHAYNIRHNYGKEGKRANYSPQSCVKIISGSAGIGEQHGCPFRKLDAANLRKSLQKNGLSMAATNEVSDLAKNGHYQLACSSYFQHMHNISEQIIVNHPNLYFDESQKLITRKTVKEEANEAPAKKIKSAPEKADDDWANMDFSAIDALS